MRTILRETLTVLFILVAVGTSFPAFGQSRPPLWKPVPDEVYLQEVGRQVKTDKPVLAVATLDGRLYAGLESGVWVCEGKTLVRCNGPEEPVRRMKTIDGALFVITDSGLRRLEDAVWQRIGEGDFADVCSLLDKTCVAGRHCLYSLEGDTLLTIPGAEGYPRRITRITSYSETIYCLASGLPALFDGEVLDDTNVIDWGTQSSGAARDLLAQGSRLYVATDGGLDVIRGMATTHLKGRDGLCYEDTTCLARGFDSDLWIGTTRGAIRMIDSEFHYFAGRRWLPDDHVNDIAVGEQAVYVATNAGVGVIEYEPYTLQKKAAYYERWLEEWGQKRLGFVHCLVWNADQGAWVRHVSDNDGGWTAHYVAAQSFRYAVTGDEHARNQAVDSFNALKWCEEISSIDGFPARAIWAKGELGDKAKGGSGGFPAEWIDTPDGSWEWKADTSADETDAHFYATAVFYELAAEGDEKERAKEHLWRIASHIIDNGWVLRDLDEKPTMWGRWDPEYFASERGFHALGLNGLEVLSYMKTAHAITGDAKFREAYDKLIGMGYLKELVRQKLTDPPGENHHPDDVLRRELILPLHGTCHPDDRLAFFHYYLLPHYETDPHLRSIYMRSLERSWEVERIEQNPWFNFTYGARTGNDCEVEQAVDHLREWPLDLVSYSFVNSHRHDLTTPTGYVPYSGGTRAISPRESGGFRLDSCTLSLDGGRGGRLVEDPSGWLDAYWMGRYYGFIQEPTTDDPTLTTIEPRGLNLGAAPYDGPPRPM